MSAKIGAIIVLYNPDFEGLNISLEILLPQVELIYLVDNSSIDNSTFIKRDDKLIYLPLLENVGIAKAQNIGIKYLLENQFDFAIFSDQDSKACEDTVSKLYTAYRSLEDSGYKVGIVGTKAVNKESGKGYPAKSIMIGKTKVSTATREVVDLTEYYSVISSISMISRKALMDIGGFDESLFIDGVDHEWCWRAWHNCGFRSYVVDNAFLYHRLGEGDKKLLGRDISIPAYKRLFYQYRNYIWLCKRDYVPRYWKRKHFIKYFIKLFYYPLFISPRLNYLKNIFIGLKEGLIEKNEAIIPRFEK